jgi:cytochrome c peroxidase
VRHALIALAIAACAPDDSGTVHWVEVDHADGAASSTELSPRMARRFRPLDDRGNAGERQALVELGRILYYDPRLSATSAVSCNSCHPLARYGADSAAVSAGVFGQQGRRNAPSTFNASRPFRQFWDGREGTLEDQARRPFLNQREMAMTEEGLIAKLSAIAGYPELFANAFPSAAEPLTFDNVAVAVAAFERGLVTPSRWDKYLRGDREALSAEEKLGAKVFANAGCVVCHTGEMLGGSMFEKVGVQLPWPNQRDRGRMEVSGSTADDMVFKVPSLRNVTQTAPYFHDGSARTIDEAVRLMARHQLGVELSAVEVTEIVAWLGSLTGEIPIAYIAPPALPGAL